MANIKLSELGPLTEEEKSMIENAANMPILYDDDSPETTPEMLLAFRQAAEEKRKQRRKNVISIRVSNNTLEKAKALGSGYSGVLARMIDFCLNDPEIIKKCL
ncbi:MAG: BrnA antitoxin family protein [Lachnospiraceae bacterium]